MATYFMFGKYSAESLKGMNAERTKKAVNMLEKLGGDVKDMYALLGQQDLVLIANFADMLQAMKASVMLSKMTGIAFTTSPAISVEVFDNLMSDA
jgi:uncharacterized protein with GYD domain